MGVKIKQGRLSKLDQCLKPPVNFTILTLLFDNRSYKSDPATYRRIRKTEKTADFAVRISAGLL